GAYTATVTVTGPGGSDSASLRVAVSNVPPAANAGLDVTAGEGHPVTLHGNFADPGAADTHTFFWHVVSSNGQVVADGTAQDFDFTPQDDGAYTVTFTVTD